MKGKGRSTGKSGDNKGVTRYGAEWGSERKGWDRTKWGGIKLKQTKKRTNEN